MVHISETLKEFKSRNDLQDSRTIQLGEDVVRIKTLLEK
jgi:hypothetical protein